MYTSTTSLLTTLDSNTSIDRHLNELRHLEESALLLEKKGTFKNILVDAGQAALSSGAIAVTGGAGGDVVVDVIFAAKIAQDVIEEVTSLINGAGELGQIILDVARLDFDGSDAFEKKVQSLLKRTVKNRFVGDKAKEMIEQASEKINEILEKIARAVGKWVGALIPDDFGLGGPAFEALFQRALQEAGKNSYAIAVAGIKALPFGAGNYLLDSDALEDLLETIATKMIEFIDNVTEWAEGQRADLEDEDFGDKVVRKALGVKDQAVAGATAYGSSAGRNFAKLAKVATSPHVALYSFANNLTDGRLEASSEQARAALVKQLQSKGVDEDIVSAVDKFYSTTGSPLKISQALNQFDEDQQQKVKAAIADYADAWKSTNKGEILYLSEKALPQVRGFLEKFRNDWIPTTVAVIRKLMSYLMAAVVLFQELIDPEEYLEMETRKGSDFESLNPLAGQGPIDLGLKEAAAREVSRCIVSESTRTRIRRLAHREVLTECMNDLITEKMIVATVNDITAFKPEIRDWAEVLVDELEQRAERMKDMSDQRRESIINSLVSVAVKDLIKTTGGMTSPSAAKFKREEEEKKYQQMKRNRRLGY